MSEQVCVECRNPREDPGKVCAACGAPPSHRENRGEGFGGVRAEDLEPYVALRYIARMFKILSVILLLMLIGEVIVGLMSEGRDAIMTLVVEATRMLVLSGLLWAAGDLALLLIDLGHDVRVSRILLWRINAEMHRDDNPLNGSTERRSSGSRQTM